MLKNSKPLFTRSKIWIEDADGNVVFGLGRFKILEAVKRLGSIHAAAKELNIGYRAVWARIHAAEERLGEKLLIKKVGGNAGGSQLSPLAETLIEHFGKIQQCIERETDELFEKAIGSKLKLNNS